MSGPTPPAVPIRVPAGTAAATAVRGRGCRAGHAGAIVVVRDADGNCAI
jgi:hypothetical protein